MIASSARRRTVPAAAAVLAATSLVLSGCSSSSPSTDEGGCFSTSRTDDARSIELPPAQVTVTNPGTGDLRVPASRPRTDAPQKVTLTTESTENSVASGNDGVQATAETLTTPLTVRAGCSDPRRAQFTFGTPTSPDDALSPSLRVMNGAAASLSFADGLAPMSLKIATPDSASPAASRAVEQSLVSAFSYDVPLPTTAVGPGATWTSVRTLAAATTVTQTMTVTLRSWEGTRLVLDVRVDEAPVDSVFRIPGSTDTLDMTKFSNSGTGTMTVDLADLLPVDGELKLAGARELVGDDQSKPILQQTALTVTWKPTA
ncbi:MAG: hypothetical protein QM774_05650 [Gordonia sp. (in: high G+C Gram-positive bacteria)]|uniref:hypothetical protein n=1 Tax=Gordonia sp. (in: high G+C Gram-positive bacteria) TaxID=84139 RepID=UPI0039E2ED6A